ncbi:MAG: hypothetical protein AAGE52_37890 [Myxococcota bacterium]
MALLLGCTNEGEPPPVGRLAFPIAIRMTEDGQHLLVANSNFDLRFNSGSLQSYNLDVLNSRVEEACAAVDPSERDDCGIIPVEDERDDLTDTIQPISELLTDQVRIGSFADGMAVARYGQVSRVYMPIRSEANLTFVDVIEGRFDCGDNAGLGRPCDDVYRRGDNEAATLRNIELPADPVGIAVGPLTDITTAGTADVAGNYVLFAHRDGRASLFFDQAEVDGSFAPILVHTISGLPEELVDIALDPITRLAWAPSARGFVGRVGVAFDGVTREPERSFLFNAGEVRLSGIDTGSGTAGDTRVVRFDPRPDVDRAYFLSRRPRALLTADLSDRTSVAPVVDAVEVGFGPSRLELATFSDPDRTLAFVSCFDSRDLYVIDVDLSRLVGIVRGLGGPFELAVDAPRERVYVVDFRTSVLRIIDLDPMLRCLRGDVNVDGECSPELLGIVGRPDATRELR